MSNLRLSYLQKVGGMFVQAIPPTQKSGGIHPPHPPRNLRQCVRIPVYIPDFSKYTNGTHPLTFCVQIIVLRCSNEKI